MTAPDSRFKLPLTFSLLQVSESPFATHMNSRHRSSPYATQQADAAGSWSMAKVEGSGTVSDRPVPSLLAPPTDVVC